MFTGLLTIFSLINNLGCIHATHIYSQKIKSNTLLCLTLQEKTPLLIK